MSDLKPQLESLRPLAMNPAKSYILNLLAQQIAAVNPARSLDAGAGVLRNLWMFPGEYIGISHDRGAYLQGLEWGPNPSIIAQKGAPVVYLTRLESDFSFVGEFDLCVCTFTIEYVKNPVDAVIRLCDRISRGGTFILEGKMGKADAALPIIAANFDNSEIVYWGTEDCKQDFALTEIKSPLFRELSVKEMRTPNRPDGHTAFYFLGRGKKYAAGPAGPPPELITEGNLRIVRKELSYLHMKDTHWTGEDRVTENGGSDDPGVARVGAELA